MAMKRRLVLLAFGWLGPACSTPPSVPEHPTWADVAPIMHGECASCHGSTAETTGGGYRLDFYDMTPDVCGEAAQALGGFLILAGSSAAHIKDDVSPTPNGDRPRMPPAPGPSLLDWERQMLLRWTTTPSKGPPPAGNHAPIVEVGRLPSKANNRLSFTAVVEDPDGEPVVGVIKVADAVFSMSHAGAFTVDLDSSSFPAGTQRLRAVVCDGWTSATYDLGPVSIEH
jgi:hypothetical protein